MRLFHCILCGDMTANEPDYPCETCVSTDLGRMAEEHYDRMAGTDGAVSEEEEDT